MALTKKTIKLKKYSDVIEEMTATAVALTPGMLLEQVAAGTCQAHSGAQLPVLSMFALEDELQGNGIDTDFAVSATIQVWIPGRGDIVNALLANGQTIVIGDKLVSNGDGKLKKYSAVEDESSIGEIFYSDVIVGYAVDAVDMSGSSAADPDGRIQVRIK